MAVLPTSNHNYPTCNGSPNNNDQYRLYTYTSSLTSSGEVKRQYSMNDSSVLHNSKHAWASTKSRSSKLIRGGVLSFLIVTTTGALLLSPPRTMYQQEIGAAKSLAKGPVVSILEESGKKDALRSRPILEPTELEQQLITGRNQDEITNSTTDGVSTIIRHAAAVVPESGGTASVPFQAEKIEASTSTPRIPNVLLAGTQKASTTSLALYLMNLGNQTNDTIADTPNIGTCFSDPEQDEFRAHGKEAHFFDRPRKFKRGLEFYRSMFQHCPHDAQLLIDGTPETMLHPHRVKAIYDGHGTADQVKIIFILREPVSREISWYNHQLRYVNLPDRPDWTNAIVGGPDGHVLSFIEAQRRTVMRNLRYRQYRFLYGYYAHWLRQWSDLFDRKKQILVLSYDELKYNPKRLLERVHTFLQIPMPTSEGSMVLPRENTNTKKTPSPPCEDQLELAEYFRGPNEELYQFLRENPGPSDIEQYPFPKFTMQCQRNVTTSTSSDIQ